VNALSKNPVFSVADVMQTDVYTLSPETPVGAARMLADGKHVNHLLVVEHEMLAGILSKEDLSGADQAAPVRDCMTSPVPCVGPETPLRDAAGIMDEQKLSCLAVVIGALLVGIITRAELTELGLASRAEVSPPEPWSHPAPSGAVCVACGSQQAVFASAAAL
jgi:CBS domain-containing protein